MQVAHEHHIFSTILVVPATESLLAIYHPPILAVCEWIDAMRPRLKIVTALCTFPVQLILDELSLRVHRQLLHIKF